MERRECLRSEIDSSSIDLFNIRCYCCHPRLFRFPREGDAIRELIQDRRPGGGADADTTATGDPAKQWSSDRDQHQPPTRREAHLRGVGRGELTKRKVRALVYRSEFRSAPVRRGCTGQGTTTSGAVF